MCRGIIKIIIPAIGALAMLWGCTTKAEKDNAAAMALMEKAEELGKNGRYAEALALVDSADKAYPQAVEARKHGINLRPKLETVYLGNRRKEIVAALEKNETGGMYKRQAVVTAENSLENYFVAQNQQNIDVRAEAGLHPRVSPAFTFYAVSACDSRVNHTSIAMTDGVHEAATAPVAYDGERNVRIGKCENITFTEAEIDTIARFVMDHPDAPLTLVFRGDSEYAIPFPDQQRQAFMELYTWVATVRADKAMRIELERIDRRLEQLGKQIEAQ